MIIRHVKITSYHPTKQPINKRTYVVRTLISLIMFKLISPYIYARLLCRYTWERTHAITLRIIMHGEFEFISFATVAKKYQGTNEGTKFGTYTSKEDSDTARI